LTDMLGVSRSPLREALVRLAQEELIETVPQKGSFVSRIDRRHVEEARFVREALETAIVREACRQSSRELSLTLKNLISLQELAASEHNLSRFLDIDDEFHRAIAYACGKQRTWRLLQQMNTHYYRLRRLRLSDDPDWMIILEQHRGIADAIAARDAERAERLMKEHLGRMLIEIGTLAAKYPHYFA